MKSRLSPFGFIIDKCTYFTASLIQFKGVVFSFVQIKGIGDFVAICFSEVKYNLVTPPLKRAVDDISRPIIEVPPVVDEILIPLKLRIIFDYGSDVGPSSMTGLRIKSVAHCWSMWMRICAGIFALVESEWLMMVKESFGASTKVLEPIMSGFYCQQFGSIDGIYITIIFVDGLNN